MPVIPPLFLASLFGYLFNVSDSCSIMSDSLWPHGLSPPGFSFHGILHAKILEWVTVPLFRIKTGSPVFLTDFFYHLSHQGSPWWLTALQKKKKKRYFFNTSLLNINCALKMFIDCYRLLLRILGLPKWFSGKESSCQYRRLRPGFDLWVKKIHWRRK